MPTTLFHEAVLDDPTFRSVKVEVTLMDGKTGAPDQFLIELGLSKFLDAIDFRNYEARMYERSIADNNHSQS